jgi:hypothetical protein
MDQLFTKNIKKFFVVLVLIFLIWLFFMSFHNSFVKDSVEIYKHLCSNDIKVNFIKKKKDLVERKKSELRDFEKLTVKSRIRDIILKLFDNFPILDNKPFIIGSALPYYEDFLLKISNRKQLN